MRTQFLLCLAIGALGCSSAGDDDTDVSADAPVDRTTEGDVDETDGTTDEGDVDVVVDADVDGDLDVIDETASDGDLDHEGERGGDGTGETEFVEVPTDVAPGTFGAPCTVNEDCDSNLCFTFGQGGPLCTISCTDSSECPDGSRGRLCNSRGVCRP